MKKICEIVNPIDEITDKTNLIKLCKSLEKLQIRESLKLFLEKTHFVTETNNDIIFRRKSNIVSSKQAELVQNFLEL